MGHIRILEWRKKTRNRGGTHIPGLMALLVLQLTKKAHPFLFTAM